MLKHVRHITRNTEIFFFLIFRAIINKKKSYNFICIDFNYVTIINIINA